MLPISAISKIIFCDLDLLQDTWFGSAARSSFGAMLKASSAQKMQAVMGDQHAVVVKLLYASFKEELAHFRKVACFN